VTASPARDVTFEELEAGIKEEIRRLAAEPPTADELMPIRNSIEATEIRSLTSHTGIARALARAESLAGDWRAAFTDRRRLADVTAEDVVRVAETWFSQDNGVIGVLQGPERDEEAGE